ncbi:MAG: histidinol dehydrogenase [Betaproteobacteria bacterium]|jgi:histidinol dehydrogenase
MKRLDQQDPNFEDDLSAALTIDLAMSKSVDLTVTDILEGVKARGDRALCAYVNQFDQIPCQSVRDLRLDGRELASALDAIPPDLNEALAHSATRIRGYHERQHQEQASDWQYEDELGNVLGQRIRPMSRVGVYAPGGKATYPSTILMTAIPAKVAGVPNVVLAVPAARETIDPVLLAAAYHAGIDELYTMGGAQAIAALAYGTESIERVDKICGPGNLYVATAKRRVFGDVGIDMVAGPSEVLVVADSSARIDWVIDDLLAQAEHDELAQAIVVSTDASVLAEIEKRLAPRLAASRRHVIASASIENRGLLLLAKDLAGVVEIINRVAPEHLELSVADPEALLAYDLRAGAVFIGEHSPEVVGDYSAGPSHVLPTSGTARFASALGTYDFVTRQSVIRCHPRGVIPLAKSAALLAEAEGLDMHAASASRRFEG